MQTQQRVFVTQSSNPRHFSEVGTAPCTCRAAATHGTRATHGAGATYMPIRNRAVVASEVRSLVRDAAQLRAHTPRDPLGVVRHARAVSEVRRRFQGIPPADLQAATNYLRERSTTPADLDGALTFLRG